MVCFAFIVGFVMTLVLILMGAVAALLHSALRENAAKSGIPDLVTCWECGSGPWHRTQCDFVRLTTALCPNCTGA